ncbi:MAG: hypothetical protein Q9200_003990 [Gallowayella weberi]
MSSNKTSPPLQLFTQSPTQEPVQEQTASNGVVRGRQQVMAHQQPAYINNIQHFSPPFPSHQRAASLSVIQQSPPAFPQYQHSPSYYNQQPVEHHSTRQRDQFSARQIDEARNMLVLEKFSRWLSLVPAVAGKNAEKIRPDYINWRSYHAGGSLYKTPVPSYKTPVPPRVQAQIENIRSKHEPAYSEDPKIKELQQALQRAETSSLEKFQVDLSEAAEYEARLEARIKVYDELIERFGGSQSSLGTEAAASEGIARISRSSSDPTHLPGANKSTKVAVEASNTPAIEPSKVLTDLVSENQALRHAVHDLAQVVSTVMTSNVAIKSTRSRLQDELFDLILKLPADDQDAFLRPFAHSTQVAEANRPAEEDAKRAMDAVRNKMVEIGQGGLLTAWDRDFCMSIPEASQD